MKSLTSLLRRVLAAVLVFGAFSPANAHPIHTTLTTVRIEDGVVTLRIKTFADDFSASVSAAQNTPTPSDWVVADGDAVAYVQRVLRVVDARGQSLPLASCGMTREGELYWLCLRVPAARDVRGLKMSNALLVERHSDQVNIVQIQTAYTRRTLLFTKGSAQSSMH